MTTTATTLTPADARELLVRAIWFADQEGFEVPPSTEGWLHRDRGTDLTQITVSLLRAAVDLAGFAGDPANLPLVLDALARFDLLHGRYDHEHTDLDPFAAALERLLRLGGEVTPAVRRLANHRSETVRLALVRGVDRSAAEFESLLRGLATDRDAEVRAAASEVLAPLGAPPWWSGLFDQDPALVIDPAEAAELGPMLTRWAELTNARWVKWDQDGGELYDILDRLPEVLARDALRRVVANRDSRWDENRIAARLGRLADGPRMVLEMAKVRDDYRLRGLFHAWAALPSVRSEATARLLLDAARAHRSEDDLAGYQLGELFERVWPDDADPTDLVEGVLNEELGLVAHHVDSVAAKSAVAAERMRTRAEEAFFAADPAWRWLHRLQHRVLDELPLERRREAARRALGSPNDPVATWGALELLGRAHDPERDPSVAAVVEAMVREPRLLELLAARSEVVRAHPDLFRRRLWDGTLSPQAAGQVVEHLAKPGDLAVHVWLDRHHDPGPGLVPEDWVGLRAIRDAHPIDRWHHALMRIPAGPFAPADRALVERGMQALRGGDEDPMLGLAVALASGGTREDLPLMDEVIRRAGDDDYHLPELAEKMRRRLGILPPRGTPPAATEPEDDENLEWMDQDDE